eukprot:TRINITY_DN141_c0_g1_i1.p1 TRINITY_DN141_c0_g1~~TRINITY_DN141_c0_g1_i1.p1  ORF type:complete len:215 (+),score=30.38 TRINITY_DN141_c0_g1_i1:60-647(+)
MARQLVTKLNAAIAQRCYDLGLKEYIHQLPACATLATLAQTKRISGSVQRGYIMSDDEETYEPSVVFVFGNGSEREDIFSPVFEADQMSWNNKKDSRAAEIIMERMPEFSTADADEAVKVLDEFYTNRYLAVGTVPGSMPRDRKSQMEIGNYKRDERLLELWQNEQISEFWQMMPKVHRKLRDSMLDELHRGQIV